MNLTTQVEAWRSFWGRVTDPVEAECALKRLRWLEGFAFHSGRAISIDHFRALQQQIEAGEKKLAELRGDFAVIPANPQSEQPDWVTR